ncbi:glycosyltransferase [Pontimonas sp.]|nr:glycosyltransferase [Pontimonas sp.]MDA8909479.1 glycosyltransferase [Pontimonas sp.]
MSVLLPIRNEGEWIQQRLENLLVQDFSDFEVIVSDNASTDKTESICRKIADTDPRVRYFRNDSDLGSSVNYSRALERARGPYAVFASGHDLWSSNFLLALVEMLDKNPSLVLCSARLEPIDHMGQPEIGKSRWSIQTHGVSSKVVRFNLVMWSDQNPFYGLVRTEAARVASSARYSVADGLVYLLRLAILGEFGSSRDAFFFRRSNRETQLLVDRVDRYRSQLWGTARPKRGSVSLLYLATATEIISIGFTFLRVPIGEHRLSRSERRILIMSSFSVFARLASYFHPRHWFR